MAVPASDQGAAAEPRAFAELRRAVMAALEQAEQLAEQEATQAARRADERARRAVAETVQCAIELDAQIGQLARQLDQTRSRLAAIREGLTAELHALQGPAAAPEHTPAAAQPPAPQAAHDSAATEASQPEPRAPAPGMSADETIRVLRAALEALSRPGQGEPLDQAPGQPHAEPPVAAAQAQQPGQPGDVPDRTSGPGPTPSGSG